MKVVVRNKGWFRNFPTAQTNTQVHESKTSQKLDLTPQDFQKDSKEN